jgi:hypothetical protein
VVEYFVVEYTLLTEYFVLEHSLLTEYVVLEYSLLTEYFVLWNIPASYIFRAKIFLTD